MSDFARMLDEALREELDTCVAASRAFDPALAAVERALAELHIVTFKPAQKTCADASANLASRFRVPPMHPGRHSVYA